MKNNDQQRPFCWKSTLALLTGGFMVMAFTLYSSHSAVIARDMEQAPTTRSWQTWHDIFDPQLPDSLAYKLDRGLEQVEFAGWQDQSKANECLRRSQSRLEASQYAWEENYTSRAITTLHKSYGYLHEAAHGWELEKQQELATQAQQLQRQIETWQQTELHPAQRDSLNRLAAQLHNLRLQFHI